VHLVISTTDVVRCLIKRGCLKTENLKLLVIDKVDEIVSYGYKQYIEDILNFIHGDT
jgi:superfamily II DNA/RNA helicase